MASKKQIYRVRFMSQDKLYEVYAERVFQGEMYGFVCLEGLIFDERSALLVDPSQERLRSEFEGVTTTIVPMHAIVRIDAVEKSGSGKITELGDNVTRFPSPVYSPGRNSD